MPKRERDLMDEIHEWRTDLLARCDNDLEKSGEYLRKKESEHPDRVVDQIMYAAGVSKPILLTKPRLPDSQLLRSVYRV